MKLKINRSVKHLYRISPGTLILKWEMMLRDCERPYLVFFFPFMRSSDITKKIRVQSATLNFLMFSQFLVE